MERATDILAYLGAVVAKNTQHYQSDFEYDKKMFREAADKADAADRTFYWMSRACGTWCFNERDVFMRDSRQNITWLDHEDEKSILTYRVLVTGTDESGNLIGDIQPFNYYEQVKRIKRSALPIHQVTGTYDDGMPFAVSFEDYNRGETLKHGFLSEIRYEPENEQELSNAIAWEHRAQERPATRGSRIRKSARR